MRRGVLALLLIATACQRSPTAPTAIPDLSPCLLAAMDPPTWAIARTRGRKSLIEESLVAATLDSRRCRVVAGRWRDEYTGDVYTDPADLEIDHRVPLRECASQRRLEMGSTAEARLRERSLRPRAPCRGCCQGESKQEAIKDRKTGALRFAGVGVTMRQRGER